MRVGVVGNYGKGNLGDDAIAFGLIDWLSGYQEVEVVRFLGSCDHSDAYSAHEIRVELRQLRRWTKGRSAALPLAIRDIWRRVAEVDRVIIGGGGLFGDSYSFAIPVYFLVALFCRLQRKRVDVVAVGVGPIRRPSSWWLLRGFKYLAKRISVRDRRSADYFRRLGVTADLANDPAFLINVQRKSSDDSMALGIMPVPFGHEVLRYTEGQRPYAEMVRALVAGVASYLSNTDTTSPAVRLFPISLGHDRVVCEDLQKEFGQLGIPAQVHIPTGPIDLVEELQGCRMVVAMRLHGHILSAVAGVPFISIAYHEKVSNFVAELPFEIPTLLAESFQPDELTSALGDVDGNLREIRSAMTAYASSARERTAAVLHSVHAP